MDKYQTFNKRFWALMIDGCVFLPIIITQMLIGNFALPKPALIAWSATTALLGWLYSVVMHARYGQTLGKMAIGVKVLNTTGTTITWWQSAVRESFQNWSVPVTLAYEIYAITNDVAPDSPDYMTTSSYVGAVILAWLTAEVICCFSNPQRRAIHDYIAETVVVLTDPVTPQEES